MLIAHFQAQPRRIKIEEKTLHIVSDTSDTKNRKIQHFKSRFQDNHWTKFDKQDTIRTGRTPRMRISTQNHRNRPLANFGNGFRQYQTGTTEDLQMTPGDDPSTPNHSRITHGGLKRPLRTFLSDWSTPGKVQISSRIESRFYAAFPGNSKFAKYHIMVSTVHHRQMFLNLKSHQNGSELGF